MAEIGVGRKNMCLIFFVITGSFLRVCAAAGGAANIVSVDSFQKHFQWAEEICN